jgi:hypothetical protein
VLSVKSGGKGSVFFLSAKKKSGKHPFYTRKAQSTID